MEKDKLAIALKFDKESDDAPKVVAKGKNEVAKSILESADKAGIEKIENPSLAKELMKLELKEEIPEELYQAVAEIMSYIYSLNEESKC